MRPFIRWVMLSVLKAISVEVNRCWRMVDRFGIFAAKRVLVKSESRRRERSGRIMERIWDRYA